MIRWGLTRSVRNTLLSTQAWTWHPADQATEMVGWQKS